MFSVRNTVKMVVMWAAIGMSLFHLYTAYFGDLPGLQQRSLHLAFIMLVGLCIYPMMKKNERPSLYYLDVAMGVAGLVVYIYFFVNYYQLTLRIGAPTVTDIIMGSIGGILLLELTRRVIGWTIPICVVFFLLYSIFGNYLPAALGNPGYDLPSLINQLFLTTEGVFGAALGVSATYVIVFVILGSFMMETKAADVFNDLALSLFGNYTGGSAKSAVVASSLFGMVSGSSVANVMACGTFTIPLMKEGGYPPSEAGAIEAISSTGGQLMPPVMGAAAFIMAEFLGVPYIKICLVAAIPAALYYLGVFVSTHEMALKRGLTGMARKDLPRLIGVIKGGWYLIAVPIILVYFLGIKSYSPSKSGFLTVVGLLVIILIVRRGKIKSKVILTALEKGFKNIIPVSVACAAAGILTGIFSLTGLGLELSSILISSSGGHLFVLLLLTMVTSLILGCGMPTVPSYMILATLIAPALIQMHVNPFAAHLFIFYFGLLSHITPPVAIASFAAAGLANSSFMKTGWTAFRIGLSIYLIPYLFVYNPSLLMIGNVGDIIGTVLRDGTALIAFVFFVEGNFITALNPLKRVLCLISGILLIPANVAIYPWGFGLFLAFIAWEGYRWITTTKQTARVQCADS